MSNKETHLQMIQGVINRLSQNSFSLKGWSVALLSALFAFSASNPETNFAYLAFVPAIAFWILDGYFLYQERLFRKLFDSVRNLDEVNIDFSMDTSRFENQSLSLLKAMFSKTLLAFHGILIFSVLIIIFIDFLNNTTTQSSINTYKLLVLNCN